MFIYIYIEKTEANKLYPGKIINIKESANINIFGVYTKLTDPYVFNNRNNEYLIYKAQIIGELRTRKTNDNSSIYNRTSILNPVKIITLLDQVKLEWTLLIEARRANNDKRVWHNISSKFVLSNDFILRNKDKVDIEAIFRYQRLNINTIEELLLFDKDNNYWFDISCNQRLNEEFIRKYKDKLYLYNVYYHNEELPDKFKEEIKEWLDNGIGI